MALFAEINKTVLDCDPKNRYAFVTIQGTDRDADDGAEVADHRATSAGAGERSATTSTPVVMGASMARPRCNRRAVYAARVATGSARSGRSWR